MNTTTILDLITAREATATAARDELRVQMTNSPANWPPSTVNCPT